MDITGPPPTTPRVAPGWRAAALVLGVLLVSTWATLGYAILDASSSLNDCRVEQSHLRHDIKFLVRAGKGKLPSAACLEARSHLYPGLPSALGPGNRLTLESITLQFNEQSLLEECSSASSQEAANNPCGP